MSTPSEQAPYFLGAIDEEVVCHIPVGEDYYVDSYGYLVEICDVLLDVARERFGDRIFTATPYMTRSTGNEEDARGEEIASGEELFRLMDSSGAVFDSGLLMGDDPADTFHAYAFPSRSIQYLPEQDWDELEVAARGYCIENGIGW